MSIFCRPANSDLFFAQCTDDTIVFFQSPLMQKLQEIETGTSTELIEIYSLTQQTSSLASLEVQKSAQGVRFGTHSISSQEMERLHCNRRWQRALALARLPEYQFKYFTSLDNGKFLISACAWGEREKPAAIIFDTDNLSFSKIFPLRLENQITQTLVLASGKVVLAGERYGAPQSLEIVDTRALSSSIRGLENCFLPEGFALCGFGADKGIVAGGRNIKRGAPFFYWTKVSALDLTTGRVNDIANLSHGRFFRGNCGWMPNTVAVINSKLIIVAGGFRQSHNLLSMRGYDEDYSVDFVKLQ